MPTRIRVVIALIAGLASVCVFGPLIARLMRAGSRPQVVITLPPDATHSPLPYSTPFPTSQLKSVATAGHSSSAGMTSSTPYPAPIQKLKNPGDGTVDINTASLAELERLPGIGPAMGARILTERSSVGRFRKASDLLEVRGIGPKKFAKMRPFVTVN